tara:strand:+ start:44676 stop:44945 length:270 start_codon:yes stop_codon:yes gene_type:complete
MSKASFTKGDWSFKMEKGKWLGTLRSSGGKVIAIFKRQPSQADMNLIATAPEMYALLENIAEYQFDKPTDSSKQAAIRELLAKARCEHE